MLMDNAWIAKHGDGAMSLTENATEMDCLRSPLALI
jgi:hypothetical protein